MNLKQTTVAAVIGGAIALTQPTPAAALTFQVKGSVEQRLDQIEKKIAELTEAVKGKRDSDGHPYPSDRGLVADVAKLRDEVAALKAQLDAQKSTSQRPAAPAAAADPLAGKGTVRIVNEYPIEISMSINGTSYRVPANTELKVPVPMGEFSYFLLSSGVAGTATKSTIKEKETVTLRVK